MPHKNAKYRIDNAYHMDWVRTERCTGEWDMPILRRERLTPSRLLGFNYALTSTRRDAGVHFFLDDYQFERIWGRTGDYVSRLASFECVLTPDFSLLMDMPAAMKIWNTYRNRAIGQFLQDNGCIVIPTVSWAEPASFSYCFDGLPTQGTVAVSSLGVINDPTALTAWHRGMDELLTRLAPIEILFYGKPIERDYGSAQIRYFSDQRTGNMKGGSLWADADHPTVSLR